MRTFTSLGTFWQDLGYAARTLRKSPGFAAVAVASLALGIMATTAIFSVVHAVVLHPFPYKDVDTLMSVKVWEPGQRGFRLYYTTDQFLEIAERNSVFEGVIASTISDVLWVGEGEPQRLRGNYVTTNTFQVLGVPPLWGRAIVPSDGAADAPSVAVLGYRFWQRQFGGDPAVIGREFRLNDKVRTVIGIMPPRFMWRGADVYLPITLQRGRVVEGVQRVHLLGRLKSGVTEPQAEADLRPIIAELQRREPAQFPEKFRVGLLSFKETFPSGIREALWILFGAVGLLLLIACANVSNLLLSRATARSREMAVRASLGAGRGRLIRQLLTESLLLAGIGAAFGVAWAFGALRAIISLVPPDTIPDESHIAINAPVLLFTVGVSVLTALLFGLAPALQISTPDLASVLKQSSRGLSGSLRHALVRNMLVVAEVALSLMLLVGASLMIRTVLAMQNVDLGFRPDRLLTLRIPLSDQRYPDPARRVGFLQELLRRLDATPGVLAAGLNTSLHPFGNWNMPVEVAGSGQQDARPVVVHQVNQDYTRALGIALLQGRMFSAAEIAGKQHLAVVNQAFVRRRLGGGDPLGRSVTIPRLKTRPFELPDPTFKTIGVVRDTLNRSLTNEVFPELYFPYTIVGAANYLVVLTQGPPGALAASIRAQVYGVDKYQPVTEVKTMNTLLSEDIFAGPRFNLVLFSVFAAMGLTLAVIGVYGVVSDSVSQQTREIGIRIALGATLQSITGMVLSRGCKLLLAGIALGCVGGLASARLLSQQIWSVSPLDPLSFALVSVVLLLVGLQACYWPARRAARVDPVSALRCE